MTGLYIRFIVARRKTRYWLEAQLVFFVMWIMGLMSVDRAISFAGKTMRRIGVRSRRHKLMLENLRRSFPEKSEAEIEAIANDAWLAMGSMLAEYVHLDRIFDFDPDRPGEGRVEVEGVPIFLDLRDNPRPFIVFTGHTGNFELLPVAAAAFGLKVTALFRPPNNPRVADRLHEFRMARMGNLVPSTVGSSFALAGELDAGRGVGVLVDQHFQRGLQTTFFDQPVRTNPLLGKLVRQYGCEVYPARCIRLPGNRYRLEIEPAIEIPRNADGDVDVSATAQLLNDKVESWVREHPADWLWYHDRWNIKHEIFATK